MKTDNALGAKNDAESVGMSDWLGRTVVIVHTTRNNDGEGWITVPALVVDWEDRVNDYRTERNRVNAVWVESGWHHGNMFFTVVDYSIAAHEWNFDGHEVLLFPSRRNKRQFIVYLDRCLWWPRISVTNVLREITHHMLNHYAR